MLLEDFERAESIRISIDRARSVKHCLENCSSKKLLACIDDDSQSILNKSRLTADLQNKLLEVVNEHILELEEEFKKL